MTDKVAKPAASRWKPGQSGNPNGRPKGARSLRFKALDDLAEREAEAIAIAVIEKAKGGDVLAATRVFERVWPPRKGARLTFDLPTIDAADDLPGAIAGITRQVAEGDLSPDEGVMIVNLLDAQRKAIETNELAARITALEEKAAKT